MKNIAKISIITIIGFIALISLLFTTVSNDTLADISSNLFLGAYVISVISASLVSATLIASNSYNKNRQSIYDKKYLELKTLEDNNKVDIRFTENIIDLYAQLSVINTKIQQLNKDK
jgi:hypothetical protein